MTYKQELRASIIDTVAKINELHQFMIGVKSLYESGSISFEEFDLALAVTEQEAEKLAFEGEALLLINDALYSSDVE